MSGRFELVEVVGISLLHVATRGDTRAAAAALAAALDLPVSDRPNSVVSSRDGRRVLWFGPGRWLVQWPGASEEFPVPPGCVVTDLSDSRRIFSVSGNGLAGFLAQYCPLDLDTRAMPPGSCALTSFDRFGLLLYRGAEQAFDLYVENSYVPALPVELRGTA